MQFGELYNLRCVWEGAELWQMSGVLGTVKCLLQAQYLSFIPAR